MGRTYDKSVDRNIEICFENGIFETVEERLKRYELKYLHETVEELWGQQTIRFYDPENNLVEIGETISCYVRRFKKQGMSIEEVSKRTFVPIEVVKNICS